MSYGGVLNKTLGSFAVLLAVAVLTWMAGPALWYPLAIAGSIGGLILGLVLAFKKEPSAPLTLLFAAAEGALVGGFSAALNVTTHGIVLYAAAATLTTFAIVLLLFRSGKLRASKRLTQFAIVAGLSYLAFSLVNFALTLFGVMPGMGLRDVEVFGIPLGIPLGIFAVILSTVYLILDFDNAKKGVESRADSRFEWTAAWSLLATITFMYIEFLRLFHYILPTSN